jgi:hypothetical protein
MVDTLLSNLKTGFGLLADARYKNKQNPLVSYLMSAFSIFHLKDPSLHHYRLNYPERSANLLRIYGIETLYSDTAIREAIDIMQPSELQKMFVIPLQMLEEQGVMSEYKVLNDYLVVAFDGTEHYCNTTAKDKPCEHCLVKEHRNKKGEVTKTTYHHQALAAVMVHPKHKEVFPINTEAIVKQDGATKNDCEQNAAKRLIPIIRTILTKEKHKLIGVFDALYATGPMIRLLMGEKMSFTIVSKETFVNVQVERLRKENKLEQSIIINEKGEKTTFRWAKQLILNGANQDILVNYFEIEQIDKEGKPIYYNAWITDIDINDQNIAELVQIARSRWKIENETFNTLKNQGYHLEHSFGHGNKFLATNFMLLTFLAFLTDQVTQKLDKSFNKAWNYCKTKKNLFEKTRQIFDLLPCLSMDFIYRIITRDIKVTYIFDS